MIAQTLAIEVGLGRKGVHWGKSAVVPPKRKPTILNVAVLVVASLAMLILAVVITARMGTSPHAPDLPQRFLPGNPLPNEAACTTLSDDHIPRCVVRLAHDDVYFNFGTQKRIISRTVIPAQQYTVGDLIAAWGTPSGFISLTDVVAIDEENMTAAWGTPSGFTWNETKIYIYWGTRSALLYARSFQPNSRVDFILYNVDQPQASLWPGFTSVKR